MEYERGTLGGERLELLLWREPGTGIHLMRFMCIGPRLIVTGDLEGAIYCRAPELRWWAGLNLHYFAEKCEASAHGRDPIQWDEEAALESAKEHIRERMEWRGRGLWRRFKELDGPDATATEHDWEDFCRAYGDEFFGQDWWEIRFGRVISIHTAYHLAGLKLAVAHLPAPADPVSPVRKEGER